MELVPVSATASGTEVAVVDVLLLALELSPAMR